MGLLITTNHSSYVAGERIYVAHDGKTIVGDGDPRAWLLLAGNGQEIPAKLVSRYGLDKVVGKPAETVSVAPEEPRHRRTRIVQPETR
jgi:hypothetical protein